MDDGETAASSDFVALTVEWPNLSDKAFSSCVVVVVVLLFSVAVFMSFIKH